ncbi:MAG: alpha/beta hydrolase fold domain-containing protein [Planctomycetota bacterium]
MLLGLLTCAASIGCAKPAPEKFPPAELDVSYGAPGSRSGTTLDVYTPPSDSTAAVASAARPAIIAIHGGAWRAGEKSLVDRAAARLAAEGYVVFGVNYSLAPAAPWPAALLDLQTAVRFVRANAARFGIDPARVGAWGASAGGHLATMLALVDDPLAGETPSGGRVSAAIDGYGPSDLTIVGGMQPDEDGILRDLLGAPRPHLTLEKLLSASTVSYARPDAAVLIIHGPADSFVSIEHSERLHDALLRAGATTQLVRVPSGGHDWSTTLAPEAWEATLAFLGTHLAAR